ncbi:hypothetical protein CLV32_3892 [Pedobacter duraquae]|uniref:Uncharacterized protein n=1 Tax=Pedobacter duraquae TaxID=425511 RepID=A0A4R6ID01_9SPHI|nr:hypothetical protein CLV32_3892 [Pedobacter duraquae]
MQEIIVVVAVLALLAFFFSPYDLKMDDDDV